MAPNKSSSTSDAGVEATALDAAMCKLSAATLGYFSDDYLQHFVLAKKRRRIPLIHRGYYLRHCAFDAIVSLFLQKADETETQILSLGAGYDTLYFYLVDNKHTTNLSMFEIDTESIAESKIKRMRESPELCRILGTQQHSRHAAHLSCRNTDSRCAYHLLGMDLGSDVPDFEQALVELGVDAKKPTLIIGECVFAYLLPEKGNTLLRWLGSYFNDATLTLYDPFHTTDASNVVGKNTFSGDGYNDTMSKYFANKGCTLRSLDRYPDVSGHCHRLIRECHWSAVHMVNMNGIYRSCCSREEASRISSIEPFDEHSDWFQCNAHYYITVATNGNDHHHDRVGHQVIQTWHQSMIEPNMSYFVQSVPTHPTAVVHPFQYHPETQRAVQHVFRESHEEYASSVSVHKFIKRCLHSDLSNIAPGYLSNATLAGQRSHFWIASSCSGEFRESKLDVLGCIGVRPRQENAEKGEHAEAEICRMGVLRSARRLGLGSALLETLERFCIGMKYQRVFLETIGVMSDAIAFYQHHGYIIQYEKVVGQPPNDFVLVGMKKDLKRS